MYALAARDIFSVIQSNAAVRGPGDLRLLLRDLRREAVRPAERPQRAGVPGGRPEDGQRGRADRAALSNVNELTGPHQLRQCRPQHGQHWRQHRLESLARHPADGRQAVVEEAGQKAKLKLHGRFSFIDLAGSERAADTSTTTGGRDWRARRSTSRSSH